MEYPARRRRGPALSRGIGLRPMEYPARRRRGSALSLGIGLRPDNNKQASGAAAGASAAPPGPASLLGPAVAAGFVIGPRSRGPASLLGPGVVGRLRYWAQEAIAGVEEAGSCAGFRPAPQPL